MTVPLLFDCLSSSTKGDNMKLKKVLAASFLFLSTVVSAAEFTGAGATFPFPIYAKWAEAYKAQTGIGLNYQSIGSGGGIRQIKAKTVDFGASDMPLKKEELMSMYQKLNFLASSLTPDYSTNGYMRGNLATLTVGNYLFEQPGIITSINYTIPEESPWEIAIGNGDQDLDPSVKELSHMIKVTGFQFIPIHTFVPRKQQNTYNQYGLDEFGKERYIALRGPKLDENGYDYIGAPLGSFEIEPTVAEEQFLNAGDQNELI